jgi:excisionase family DNA binding protein
LIRWKIGRTEVASIREVCLSEAEARVNMKERWLSVEDIAAHLGVNPDTIQKSIERKKLPAHKEGRLWKFMASEVDGLHSPFRLSSAAEERE